MFLCSLTEELCTKKVSDKTGYSLSFEHQCRIIKFFQTCRWQKLMNTSSTFNKFVFIYSEKTNLLKLFCKVWFDFSPAEFFPWEIFSLNFMFLCSFIEELCPKEENFKTGCSFNFEHQCILRFENFYFGNLTCPLIRIQRWSI